MAGIGAVLKKISNAVKSKPLQKIPTSTTLTPLLQKFWQAIAKKILDNFSKFRNVDDFANAIVAESNMVKIGKGPQNPEYVMSEVVKAIQETASSQVKNSPIYRQFMQGIA